MIKILFTDLETSGIDHTKHGITQIASILIHKEGNALSIIDTYSTSVKLFRGQLISQEAMEKTGLSKEQIETFPEPETVFKEYQEFLGKHCDKFNKMDKYFFAGYNSKFDNDFLREFWKRNNDQYFGSWFWSNQLDIMSLATDHLMDKRTAMPNFQLSTVAQELQIQLNDAHDALSDIQATVEIYKKIKGIQ